MIASGLAFPGKVFADAELGRLFVADSNHNRIVVTEWPDVSGRAKVVQIVGRGEIGATDGPADQAAFNHPQGLVTGQGNLYVCDTENHLIRKIDLESYEVSTVVGTGKMTYDFAGGRMGTQQGINSPWDVVREGSTLYVAMAGQHQIWRIDLPVDMPMSLDLAPDLRATDTETSIQVLFAGDVPAERRVMRSLASAGKAG